MKVEDVMISIGNFPIVAKKTILKEALTEMGEANLGLVCIVNESKELLGLITDGDIRRLILRVQKPLAAIFVDEAYSYSTIKFTEMDEYTLLSDAVIKMEKLKLDLRLLNNHKVILEHLYLQVSIPKTLN